MKKKFVMAVAAVAMAAVMSVSAFAADGVKVSSITGDSGSSDIFVDESESDSSEIAKATYNTIASTEGSTTDKLTAVAGSEAVASAASTAGVESAEALSIRAIGDVTVSGRVSVSVAGVESSTTVVVMYLDAHGVWKVTNATVVNGQVVFNLPYPTTVIILTKKAA